MPDSSLGDDNSASRVEGINLNRLGHFFKRLVGAGNQRDLQGQLLDGELAAKAGLARGRRQRLRAQGEGSGYERRAKETTADLTWRRRRGVDAGGWQQRWRPRRGSADGGVWCGCCRWRLEDSDCCRWRPAEEDSGGCRWGIHARQEAEVRRRAAGSGGRNLAGEGGRSSVRGGGGWRGAA